MSLEIRHDLLVFPDMISRGDNIYFRLEELLGGRWCKSNTSSGVLAISDDQIDPVLLSQVRD
jgi:hypothetical protein